MSKEKNEKKQPNSEFIFLTFLTSWRMGHTTSIINQPSPIGSNHNFDYLYTYGGERIRSIEVDTLASGETRQRVITYVGPMQFLNDTLERITHSDGRILIDQDDGDKHLQYRIGDHLDNTVASFEDKNGDGILQDPEEILIKKLYYPFGMALEGMIPDSTIPPARFLYNNKEFETAGGVYFYGARLYVPVIGRFAGVDPLADAPANIGWSPYSYVWNNPLRWIDPTGMHGEDPTDPPCDDCTYSGGTLPTITVTASRTGGTFHDQTPERYGFNGTFEQWQQTYGFEGMSFENASNYWTQVHGADFDNWVAAQDKAEAGRIAVEKMKMFTFMMSTSGSMGMGALSPSLVSPRGFSFSSPVSSSSSNNWLTLSSLDDVQGVSGLYQFPHAARGNLPYVGQSGNIGLRISTHFRQGNIGGNILYRPMSGSTKLMREIGETRFMLNRGFGNTANMRFPVSRARSSRLGLGLYD